MMKLTNEQVSRILWVSGCYIEDSMDYGVVPDNVKDNVQYLGNVLKWLSCDNEIGYVDDILIKLLDEPEDKELVEMLKEQQAEARSYIL